MATIRESKKFVSCKASQEQKAHLLRCLERNTSFFFGGDKTARQKAKLWSELADELNALGGAHKSGSKWLKYWYDQRSYVRERAAEVYKMGPGTNTAVGEDYYDPTSKIRILNDYERRVLALVTPSEEPEKYLLEIEPLTVENVEQQSAQEGLESLISVDDDESNEAFTKRIKLEWDSDGSNYSQIEYDPRKPSQSEQIEEGPPLEKITEVIIKSEFSMDPSSSPDPSSADLSDTRTKKLPTKFNQKPTETNNKLESKGDSSKTVFKLGVPPKHSNNTTKSTKIVEFSTPIQLEGVTYICGTCKSTPSSKSNNKLESKTLAIMEEAEKFNREIELKKLQVEEKKLEALNKLINVVQGGFDRMAELATL